MSRLKLLAFTLAINASAFGSFPLIGELSSSINSNGMGSSDIQFITRYLPAFEIQNNFSDSWDYDLEVRWQLAWSSSMDPIIFSDSVTQFEPYRIALNFQSQQSEYIIGLQKINFGPARVLRSLMWFDSVNPTDPLELTPGVTGISATHFFNSGWSSQAWLLLPGDPIGWEVFSGRSGSLAGGGRITIPNSRGQIGLSTHWRMVDISQYYPEDSELSEGRLALDGFWDIGIGLWFESVYKNQQLSNDPFLEQLQTTLGADYTFWVGNGILLVAEHMTINTWNSPLVDDKNINFSTAMLTYSPTMFDQISLMFFMDWETEIPLTYLSWGQTYDAFRFSLGGFYSSKSESEDSNSVSNSAFSGNGLQLTVAYNH